MRSVSAAGRVAAIAAVVLAVVLVAVILFRGTDDEYKIKAEFINASQLVEGNLVQVGGTKAGSVEKIEVTEDGRAGGAPRRADERPTEPPPPRRPAARTVTPLRRHGGLSSPR